MGCDIHCYVEYQDNGSNYWKSFGGYINPGRNYTLFGMLAGVRSGVSPLYASRGVAENLGFWSSDDYWLHISDKHIGDDWCTTEKAAEWAKYGSVYSENGNQISHPDYHSHSWLTFAEFQHVLRTYHEEEGSYEIIEYDALCAAMEVLSRNHAVRIVFWFDN